MSNKYPGGFVSLGGPVSNSVLFNGSNQYLSIPDNAALEVGSSNFTVEAWIYLTAATPANGASVINKSNTGSYGPFSIGSASTGYLQFVASTSGSNWEVILNDTTQALQLGTWYHIAACRSGSNFYLFKNGALVASGSNAGTLINNTETMKIAWVNYPSTYFPGYLSNVRLVIGTALYTSNFAPPTGPLQNITNTALLTCQSSTIVDNSTANSGSGWTITNNNGAVVSATTPFTAYNPNNLDPALGASTPGVWTLSQALNAEVTRSWPMYDPYYKNVVLNLHGETPVGGTFVSDASTNSYAVAVVGTVLPSALTPFTTSSANGSGNFGGTANYYLTIPSSQTPLDLSTGDFTVECWINMTNVGALNIVLSTGTTWQFGYDGSGSRKVYVYNGSDVMTSTTAATVNTWNHIAWTRSGTTMRIFLNGTQVGTATNSSPVDLGGAYLGTYASNPTPYPFYGYISNLRIVKGTALYTSTFTPSTTALTAVSGTSLLTLQTPNPVNNNYFVDSSSNAYSLTRGGSLTQGTFTPYGQNYSNYFNGSGDYLSTPSSTPLDLGASDFTIEAWVYVGGLTSYVTANIISKYSASNTNWMFNLVRSGSTYDALSFYTPSGGATASYAFAFNTWYHVAVTRSGTSMRLYVNGVDIGGATFAITIGSSAEPIRIGEIDYSGYYYYWNGYISNLRLVKGAAVYTSNFTPSTTPLTAISGTSLLTCQSNRFKDNSSNDAVITPAGSASVQRFQPFLFGTQSAIGGSAYNPGSANLTTTYSGSVGSTADFTVEGWFYLTGNTDNGTLAVCDPALAIICTQSGQKLSTYLPSTGFIAWQASALVQNTWHYIVVQRSSSTLSCYLNGVRLGTQTSATGGWTYNGAGFALTGQNATREIGYYTDVRISTIARYSGTTMTVPTVPLTSDANTTFLLSMANAGVEDNSAMSNLATVGDAKISTSVKKYGTGSISFDGTGDWLYAAAGLPNFGTGDFTVEMWVYRNSTASGVLARSGGSTTSGSLGQWMLYFESSSPARMYWMDTVGSSNKWGVSTTSFPTGTWVHVAVARQSGVWKVFFDGVSQAATVGTFTDTTNYSNAQLSVGGNFTGYNFNGYIDDLRITNGTARYTANFTPPTSQLQDQ